MNRVQWVVRATPCRDHPNEEWLTMTIGGCEVLALCTLALGAFAAFMRGKDMIQIGGDGSRGVSLWVRDLPCANHPDSEWLTLSDNGEVLFSGCVVALTSLARLNRGRDIVRLLGPLTYQEAASDDQDYRHSVDPNV